MATATLDRLQVLRVPTNGFPVLKRPSYISVAEYLKRERAAVEKSEYVDGEMRKMSGASYEHSVITVNITGELYIALKKRSDCKTCSGDIRIHVPATNRFRYPDGAIVCAQSPIFYPDEHNDILLNPFVIVEVLSPSTEAEDRGDKFAEYQLLESFAEYVLVSQHTPRVEVYSRESDGDWKYHNFVGLSAMAHLPRLGISIALHDVYDKIEFSAPDAGESDEEENSDKAA